MKKYDEYQRLVIYKYGYYAFLTLVGLFSLNTILGQFFNLQWGETKEIEMLFLMFVTLLLFIVVSVYHNAYFRKIDNKKSYLWLFLIGGLFNLFLSIQTFFLYPENMFIYGKIRIGFVSSFPSLIFLSIPVTYFIRNRIDKIRGETIG